MPFDATLGEPSERARRLARNTQLILQEECQLQRVCDPAGGSWHLESLTDSIAHSAWILLQQIESRGGMIACLRDGWVKEQIDKAAEPRLKNLSTRRDAVLGVSEFATVEEPTPQSPVVDMKAVRRNARQLVSARRASAATIAPSFSPLSAWAADAAVRCATLGQIWSAMPHGEATFIGSPLALHTFGEAFERLRDASDAYLEQCGARPRVFVASIGPVAKHLARTNFTKNFFEAGGFDLAASDGYPTADAAAQALRESACRIAVIASDDETYKSMVPTLAPALHAAGARTVVLAGNPGANEKAYRDAGVDRFIFIKCDVVRTLSELLAEEGVIL
jgi:methylmalonyl-CoA mutase